MSGRGENTVKLGLKYRCDPIYAAEILGYQHAMLSSRLSPEKVALRIGCNINLMLV